MRDNEIEHIRKLGARALAVTRRAAQERRAKEWEAYAKGGPCPPLSDEEVTRLMREIFGPEWKAK